VNAAPSKSKITYKGGGAPRQEFTMEFLESFAKKLSKKAPPVTVLDNQIVGLRAILRPGGKVSFHVQFKLDQGLGRQDPKPYQKIGSVDDGMTVAEAREIASIVKELGAKGVDIRQGPRPEQLRTELLAWRADWRPGIVGVPEVIVRVNLDAADLDGAAPPNPNGALVFEDSECAGLQAVLRAGEPVRFHAGKSVLGTYPETTIEEARTRARAIADLIAKGVTL
jgi:hypothetical protein